MAPEPTDSLVYLTYFSQATGSFSQSELKRLMELARRNNTDRQISGLLIYRDGHFLQYLEGTLETVKSTYEHIAKDPRHHSLRVVGTGPIEGRVFDGWYMSFKNFAGIRAANTEGYSECMQPGYRPAEEGDPAAKLTKLFYELTQEASEMPADSGHSRPRPAHSY